MLLNLADIADNAPGGLQRLQAQWIVDDTNLLLEKLEKSAGSRKKFIQALDDAEAEPNRVTTRIARLVYSCYRNAEKVQQDRHNKWLAATNSDKQSAVVPITDRYREEDWRNPDLTFEQVIEEVNEQLRVFLIGWAYSRFCEDLARFCKLDYALYFFGEMARQFNLDRLLCKEQAFPLADFVAAIIEILKSIVDTYRELGHDEDWIVPRIGVQMQALLRGNIKEEIARLLAQRPPRARRYTHETVSWITNEVSVWLFI
jgi:hypothetical protein